jgi:hypothetical protein
MGERGLCSLSGEGTKELFWSSEFWTSICGLSLSAGTVCKSVKMYTVHISRCLNSNFIIEGFLGVAKTLMGLKRER